MSKRSRRPLARLAAPTRVDPVDVPLPIAERSHLEVLGEVVARLGALAAERDRLVLAARAGGASWTELAGVLGCSPQAVQQRVSRMPQCPPQGS